MLKQNSHTCFLFSIRSKSPQGWLWMPYHIIRGMHFPLILSYFNLCIHSRQMSNPNCSFRCRTADTFLFLIVENFSYTAALDTETLAIPQHKYVFSIFVLSDQCTLMNMMHMCIDCHCVAWRYEARVSACQTCPSLLMISHTWKIAACCSQRSVTLCRQKTAVIPAIDGSLISNRVCISLIGRLLKKLLHSGNSLKVSYMIPSMTSISIGYRSQWCMKTWRLRLRASWLVTWPSQPSCIHNQTLSRVQLSLAWYLNYWWNPSGILG